MNYNEQQNGYDQQYLMNRSLEIRNQMIREQEQDMYNGIAPYQSNTAYYPPAQDSQNRSRSQFITPYGKK